MFVSPALGELTLSWEALSVTSMPGHMLLTYVAEPGSPSANRIDEFMARDPSRHD
jgi:hypothetical protein